MVKNLMLVSALLVSLVAGLGLGYGLANPTQYERRIAGLENEIAELESQVSSFLEQIEAKDHQILSLGTQLSGLEQKIEMRNREISNLQSEVSSLETQVTVLTGETIKLRQQLETVVLGIYFSPKGGCEDQVLYWIDRANVSIHILIYSFTLDSISGKLIEAHQRGVEVRVVFEKQQVTEYSEYSVLKAAGISVRNDTNPDYMHHKVMIIDGILILTGSFNYSAHAEEENNENLIVIESTYVAGIYEDEFQKIWSSSI